MRPNVVNGQNVGMVQQARGASLLLKAAKSVRARGKFRRENLDGHLATQPRIARAIYLTHSARPKRGKDFIWAEPRVGIKCHNFAGGIICERWAKRNALPGLNQIATFSTFMLVGIITPYSVVLTSFTTS